MNFCDELKKGKMEPNSSNLLTPEFGKLRIFDRQIVLNSNEGIIIGCRQGYGFCSGPILLSAYTRESIIRVAETLVTFCI